MALCKIVAGGGGSDTHYFTFDHFDSVNVDLGFEPRWFFFKAVYAQTGRIDHVFDKDFSNSKFLQINSTSDTVWRDINSTQTIVAVTSNGFTLNSMTYSQYSDIEIYARE